jgi:hypothetical protein
VLWDQDLVADKAAARAAYSVAKDPENPARGRRLLALRHEGGS